MTKLDPFAERLTSGLKTEAGKSCKQRRTLRQLNADLVLLGFTARRASLLRTSRKNSSCVQPGRKVNTAAKLEADFPFGAAPGPVCIEIIDHF
ncbi:hypothetical protein [Rhizobium leguminosarum]